MFYKKIKDMEWSVECDASVPYRVMAVQIGFSTEENENDEVEFCISAWNAKELAELFKGFCKENSFMLKEVVICSIAVVRVAATMDELVKMESGCEEKFPLLEDGEAEILMKEGHSLEELAEIFLDKEERRGIYVNSCLVYQDFEKISKALQFSLLYQNGRVESKTRFRLFVDMDGTLTKFIPQDSAGVLYQKGYFLNLPPQENVVEAVKIIVREYPEIEVFVLSAFLADSGNAYMEKVAWLDAILPQIDPAHRIFVPNGSNKREYVRNFSDADVLLDDHTPNLNKWAPARGIKLINDINNKNGSWQGEKVSYDEDPKVLAEKLVEFVMSKNMFCNPTGDCMKEMICEKCSKMEKCTGDWMRGKPVFCPEKKCENQPLI